MQAISTAAAAPGWFGVSVSSRSSMRFTFVGSSPRIAGVILSRIAAASSGPVCGDLATLEGSMLLIPIAPSESVMRTTTHFVAFFDTPALVNVPTSGMATPNVSTRSILTVIGLFSRFPRFVELSAMVYTARPRFATVPIAALAFAAGPCLAQDSAVQAYPSKPVRLIVSTVAGSQPDMIARTIAQKMSESWGRPVVMENRPGGGGLLAATLAQKATPDGHTLFYTLPNFTITPALQGN